MKTKQMLSALKPHTNNRNPILKSEQLVLIEPAICSVVIASSALTKRTGQ